MATTLNTRNWTRAWCPRCSAEVDMISLEAATVFSNVEKPLLEQWLNSGKLHQVQETNGTPKWIRSRTEHTTP